MILLRLSAVGIDGSRVMLHFDDGTKTRVPTSVVTDLGLYGGMELSESDFAALMETAQRASAKQRAARIVSATSISERSLRRRLVQRGETPEDAEAAVEWLKDLGAIDDEAVARQTVSRCIAKGYGANRARQELYAKGVPKDFWDSALGNYPDMSEEIDRFLERRFQGVTLDQKTIKKAADALCRRGHNWESISAALRRYEEKLEDSDGDKEI